MLDNASQDTVVAARLRQARLRAGYQTATEFARANRINMTTYHHHENGRRVFNAQIAALYARALNVGIESLLYGAPLPRQRCLPISGSVGAGGEVNLLDVGAEAVTPAPGEDPDPNKINRPARPLLAMPDPARLVALRIAGDALWPAYRDGDIVLHSHMMRDHAVANRLHGRECVIELRDGRWLVRQISAQNDGLATLIGYATAPLLNQHIAGAAPIELVVRAARI